MSSNGNNKFNKAKFDRNNPFEFDGEKVVNKKTGSEIIIGTLIIEPPHPKYPDYDKSDADAMDKSLCKYIAMLGGIKEHMTELGWTTKKVICVDGKNWVDLKKFIYEIGSPDILYGCDSDNIERYEFDNYVESFYRNESESDVA